MDQQTRLPHHNSDTLRQEAEPGTGEIPPGRRDREANMACARDDDGRWQAAELVARQGKGPGQYRPQSKASQVECRSDWLLHRPLRGPRTAGSALEEQALAP